MNFVKIPNAFIDEQKIKENEYFLLVMALIERNRTIRGEIVFTNDYLFELLGIKKNDTRARKKIIEAVSYLLNSNIVTSYHEMGNMIFVTTNEVKDNFFMVYDDEVNTILDTKDVKKYKLFNVFCCIKRSINNENKITFIGQEKLVELTGYSSSTIVEMKKLLKDIGLLNIDNAGAVVVKTIQGKNKIINASDYMSCKTDDATGEILKEKVKLEKTKLANEYGKVLNKTKGNTRVVLETNPEQKKEKSHINGKNNNLQEYSTTKSRNSQMNYKEMKMYELIKKVKDRPFALIITKIKITDINTFDYLKSIWEKEGKQKTDKISREVAKAICELNLYDYVMGNYGQVNNSWY